jgi:hypothetical protein
MAKKETLGAYLNRNIKELGSTLAKEKAKGKKYKSIAAAKKAGALYYTNKAGKIMAAVYGEDLKVRPAASELMNSGIKKSKLPPAGIRKTNRMDNPPPDLKRTAKLRTVKTTGDGTGDPYNTKTKVPPKKAPRPEKNKGGPVTKKPKGAYAAGGMPMVMKGGKKVPAFAADGVGKMNMGGMAAKKKKPAAKKMMAGGMAAKKSPVAKKMMGGGMAKKSGYMYGGMAKKKMKK